MKKTLDWLITISVLCLYAILFLMFHFRLNFSKPALILLFTAISVLKIITDLKSDMGQREKRLWVSVMVGALVVFVVLIIVVP